MNSYVHIAGGHEGLVQRCILCDKLLVDNRETVCLIEDADRMPASRAWTEGVHVLEQKRGGFTQWTLTDAAADCVNA